MPGVGGTDLVPASIPLPLDTEKIASIDEPHQVEGSSRAGEAVCGNPRC